MLLGVGGIKVLKASSSQMEKSVLEELSRERKLYKISRFEHLYITWFSDFIPKIPITY